MQGRGLIIDGNLVTVDSSMKNNVLYSVISWIESLYQMIVSPRKRVLSLSYHLFRCYERLFHMICLEEEQMKGHQMFLLDVLSQVVNF